MFTEDLSPFFDVADFASAATLDGVPVTGIFDASYVQAFDGIAATSTAYMLPSSDCATVTPHMSVLVHAGITYRVRTPQPDGTGVTVLYLERQP